MSVEQNKSLIRRIFDEGMNQNKPPVFDEVIGPTYFNRSMPAPVAGPEGYKMTLNLFTAAFPDMQVILEDVLGEEDKVVTRGYFTGTHQGELNGIPATGKSVKIDYVDIWRLENSQAVENWVQIDMMSMMQQLGVIPTPEQ